MNIAIVGAGVSGLTCGVVLQESGYDVTLFDSAIHKPASPVAAAIWYPYHIGDEAESWALKSYRTFEQLAHDPRTGVSMVEFHVSGEALPKWAHAMPHHSVTATSYIVEVPLIETPMYLPWLRAQLPIHARTIDVLAELEHEFDLVVNCSGLGARKLCNDALLHSGRGVILKVPNPGITRHAVALENETLTYIVSRTDDIILGGTDDAVEDDHVPDEVAQQIRRRCALIDSRLPADYAVDVGFRPLRSASVSNTNPARASSTTTGTAARASPCRGDARGRCSGWQVSWFDDYSFADRRNTRSRLRTCAGVILNELPSCTRSW